LYNYKSTVVSPQIYDILISSGCLGIWFNLFFEDLYFKNLMEQIHPDDIDF